MIKHQLLIGLALIVGAAIGYFAAPTPASTEAAAAETEDSSSAALIEDQGDRALVESLRARIRELEAAAETASEPSNVVEEVAERPRERRRRGFDRGAEWMENLKKTDPERYTQMTNRFAAFVRQRAERQQAKLDFFSSIDTSGMSAESRENHERLQALLSLRASLEGDLQSLTPEDDESRHELFGRLREIDRELHQVKADERANLLEATGKALGLSAADTVALAETVQEIYEATEDERRGPPPGERRGGAMPFGPVPNP